MLIGIGAVLTKTYSKGGGGGGGAYTEGSLIGKRALIRNITVDNFFVQNFGFGRVFYSINNF